MITITDKAIEKALQFIKDDAFLKGLDEKTLYLRVYVSGGGCSGLSYGMGIEDEEDKEDTDLLIEKNGVRILVDEYSLKHLANMEIDYIDNLMGSGFKFNNPNVTKSCSCGHSFSTE